MTDNEIIKADELVSRLHKYCFLYQIKTGESCGFTDDDFDFLHDLINRQKAEIEELRKGLDIWTDIAHRETQYVEQAKTEAYKEFAERLKESTFFIQDEDGFDVSIVYISDIDRTSKEFK